MADDTYTAYDEPSTVFPQDLSKTRYISFNFYDSNFTDELKDVVVDLLAYSAKGVDSVFGTNAFTEGLSTSASTVSKTLKTFNLNDTDVYDFSGQLATRVAEKKEAGGNNLKETTLTQLSKGFNARSAIENGTFKFAVYLPLVNGMREQNSQNFSPQDGIVAGTMGQMLPKSVSGAMSNIGNFFGARTLMTNPDYVQTYQGASLRAFVLSWVLMPNSKQEARDIFNIVRQFKRASSPQRVAGGAGLLPPLFCQIQFQNLIIEDSLRMEEMVITNISVNYSESGFMETFRDGVPKAIMLELSINERRMRDESDWIATKAVTTNVEGGSFFERQINQRLQDNK